MHGLGITAANVSLKDRPTVRRPSPACAVPGSDGMSPPRIAAQSANAACTVAGLFKGHTRTIEGQCCDVTLVEPTPNHACALSQAQSTGPTRKSFKKEWCTRKSSPKERSSPPAMSVTYMLPGNSGGIGLKWSHKADRVPFRGGWRRVAKNLRIIGMSRCDEA